MVWKVTSVRNEILFVNVVMGNTPFSVRYCPCWQLTRSIINTGIYWLIENATICIA